MMDQPFIIDPTPPVTSQLRVTTALVFSSQQDEEGSKRNRTDGVLTRTLLVSGKFIMLPSDA
jgi:hypothetical protein